MNKTSIRGNALWLILLAIFLLGGLTVLLARTGNQTEDTGSAEAKSIKASKIIGYAAEIRTGVESLISRGCGEEEISFENTVAVSENYANAKSPVDKSCHIFEPEGAGLVFKAFSDDYFVAPNTRQGEPIFYQGNSLKDIGSTKPELLISFNHVSKDMCMTINRQLGVSNVSGDAPAETVNTGTGAGPFRGTYSTAPSNPIGDAAEMYKKKSGCYYQTGNLTYQFFTLLIPR